MQITLPPDVEQFVRGKIAAGQFSDASEVVRQALRLMDNHDQARQAKLKRLRAEVQKGIDDIERGDYRVYTDETLGDLFNEIEQEALAEERAGQHA